MSIQLINELQGYERGLDELDQQSKQFIDTLNYLRNSTGDADEVDEMIKQYDVTDQAQLIWTLARGSKFMIKHWIECNYDDKDGAKILDKIEERSWMWGQFREEGK